MLATFALFLLIIATPDLIQNNNSQSVQALSLILHVVFSYAVAFFCALIVGELLKKHLVPRAVAASACLGTAALAGRFISSRRKNMLASRFNAPRRTLALICLACVLMLGFGLYLQHVVGLDPCPMCIVQR